MGPLVLAHQLCPELLITSYTGPQCQQDIVEFLWTPGFSYQSRTHGAFLNNDSMTNTYIHSPHTHTQVPTTHQSKHSAPT